MKSELMQSWEEYCNNNELPTEDSELLEPYWQASQDKMFAFVIKLLI